MNMIQTLEWKRQANILRDRCQRLEELLGAQGALAEDMAKALEPFAGIIFDFDGYDFEMADIIFEARTLATVKTCADHVRFGQGVDKARAALDRFRAAKKEQA